MEGGKGCDGNGGGGGGNGGVAVVVVPCMPCGTHGCGQVGDYTQSMSTTTLHVLIGVVYKAAACMLSCYAAIQQVLCCVRRVRATVMLADGS